MRILNLRKFLLGSFLWSAYCGLIWAEGVICIPLKEEAVCPRIVETILETEIEKVLDNESVGMDTFFNDLDFSSLDQNSGGEFDSANTQELGATSVSGNSGGSDKDNKTQISRGFRSGESSIGINGTFSKDVRVYTIPASYTLNPTFKLSASIPYIQTKSTQGLGNVLLGVKHFYEISEQSALLSSLGFRFPNGNEEVGARQAYDIQFGQGVVQNFETSRLFGSYVLVYRPEDETGFDAGESIGFFLGLDTPIPLVGEQTNIYSALIINHTAADQSKELNLANPYTLFDTILGVTFRDWNLRIGVVIPTFTQSETIAHSSRNVLLDIGFRYNLK